MGFTARNINFLFRNFDMLQNQSANVTTFNSAQFGDLRTYKSESGNVWFCLNDVVKAPCLSHVIELKKRLQENGCSSIAVPLKDMFLLVH